MIKKTLLLFLFSFSAMAQQPINKGEKAPEDGVFFTNLEAATIIAEMESSDKKLKFELEEQKKRLDVLCDGQKEIKDIKINIQKEKYEDLLAIRKRQLDDLTKELEKESVDYSMWWFAGGATVATITSVAIFFAATQIDKMPSLVE